MTQLPLLPRLLNAVPKLSKVQAALVAVVTQVVIPVQQAKTYEEFQLLFVTAPIGCFRVAEC